ncbi:MAG: nucleotidyltransferase [bacterium]
MRESGNHYRTAIQKTIDILDKLTIRYAIIGGIAVARHGITRTTKDLDFIVNVIKIKIPGMLEHFRKEGFDFDEKCAVRELSEDSFARINYKSIPVDFMLPVIPLFYTTIERSLKEEMFDRIVRIASSEDLILLKLLSFRDIDREDIKGILAANTGRLEVEYIFDWIRKIMKPDDIKIKDFQELIDKYY